MYDVVIVGAGPAGSMLARLIGTTHRVLLLEKRVAVRPSTMTSGAKCCGGLLAPDAQRQLARLGLGLPHDLLVGPQLFVVRTIDIDHHQECFYQRHYINMDRGRFDQWLLSLLPGPVDVRLGCRVISCTTGRGGAEIVYTYQGKTSRIQTGLVVGADGAGSVVRRYCPGRVHRPDSYYAIQEWHSADRVMPYFTAIFDRTITDFYAWIIPKEDTLLLGAALQFGVDVYERMEHLRQRLRSYGLHFNRPERIRSAVLVRPRHIAQLYTGTGRIALVGEAAGFISPSSAEGLSYAFKSAFLLADVVNKGTENVVDRYARSTLSLRLNILGKNLKSPFMYYPPLRNLVMTLGLKNIHPYH
jgi:flavin-dependent dehydrogenase